MKPKVSVVIPTYNRACDVVRAVKSALAQTLVPHQIIVVDDGSTDDTEAAVRALPAPVEYIRQKNGGVSSARNLAFRSVTGDFVALLDSDDYWEARWLETATRSIVAMSGAGAACCTCSRSVMPDGRELSPPRQTDERKVLGLPDLMLGGMMGSNVVVRTEVLKEVGDFDASLQTGEDIDFALRVAAITTIVPVAEPLVNVTFTPGSLSKSIDTGNRLRVYERFERQFPELVCQHARAFRDARVKATLGYARDLMWARQFPAATQRLRESWSYGPSWEAAVLRVKLALLTIKSRGR